MFRFIKQMFIGILSACALFGEHNFLRLGEPLVSNLKKTYKICISKQSTMQS